MDLNSRQALKLDLDAMDILLGAWLFLVPLIYGATFTLATVVVLMAIGVIVIADAVWAWASPDNKTPEWVMGLVGLVLFVAPWTVGFQNEPVAAWNAWIIGAILAVDGLVTQFLAMAKTSRSGHHRAAH